MIVIIVNIVIQIISSEEVPPCYMMLYRIRRCNIISLSLYIYIYMSVYVCVYIYIYTVKALLVKCPSVQWQPDGLTIHAKRWLLGAGFLGAPSISLADACGHLFNRVVMSEPPETREQLFLSVSSMTVDPLMQLSRFVELGLDGTKGVPRNGGRK